MHEIFHCRIAAAISESNLVQLLKIVTTRQKKDREMCCPSCIFALKMFPIYSLRVLCMSLLLLLPTDRILQNLHASSNIHHEWMFVNFLMLLSTNEVIILYNMNWRKNKLEVEIITGTAIWMTYSTILKCFLMENF